MTKPIRGTLCARSSKAAVPRSRRRRRYPKRSAPNYIGVPVHVASRICDAAHGGQIVVSADTRTAARGAVPTGVRFRNLGQHRLRGIPDEIALYQIGAKGLRGRFPPLRVNR